MTKYFDMAKHDEDGQKRAGRRGAAPPESPPRARVPEMPILCETMVRCGAPRVTPILKRACKIWSGSRSVGYAKEHRTRSQ